jgi:putative transcriptional regulator
VLVTGTTLAASVTKALEPMGTATDTWPIMAGREYLTNQFLIAMPAMTDANFAQTVTYIWEHNDDGALGIIINRPLQMKLAEVFEQLKMPTPADTVGRQSVLQGGPVQTDRGFVLHDIGGDWEHTRQVSSRIQVTTSPDILDAMARGTGPATAVVALGYAGWSAGQLEHELTQNAWLTVPADERIIFSTPFEQRWHAAGRLLGIDLTTISPLAGHA